MEMISIIFLNLYQFKYRSENCVYTLNKFKFSYMDIEFKFVYKPKSGGK